MSFLCVIRSFHLKHIVDTSLLYVWKWKKHISKKKKKQNILITNSEIVGYGKRRPTYYKLLQQFWYQSTN